MKLFELFRFCIPTVAILFSMLCPFEADAQFENPNNSTLSSEEDQDSYKSAGQNMSPNLTMLFSNVGQSVVHISEAREVSLGSSQGSGFVFDNLGQIVTNYYTVADPQESQ